MGNSEESIKSVVKAVVAELLADSAFMDKILEKVTDKLDRLDKIVKRKSEKISSVENKLQSLSNEFESYKKSNNLQNAMDNKNQQIKDLESKIEQIQQNEKLNNLCVYGININNEGNEKIHDTVLKIFNNVVKVKVNATDILSCYKIGKATDKTRPIIVRFFDVNIRNTILKNCKNLKGTHMGITEDLVKKRLFLYRKAQEAFDRKSVFVRNGRILVKIGDVMKRIQEESDICKLQ